jgi:hypothetical protein
MQRHIRNGKRVVWVADNQEHIEGTFHTGSNPVLDLGNC